MRRKTYRLEGPASKKKYIVGALVLVLLAGGGVAFHISKHPKHGMLTHVSITQLPSNPANTYTSVAGKYLFSGTIMMGRAVATYAKGDYNQPFSGVSTLGTYDTRIGVLECPVTNNTVSYQTQVDSLIFDCSPQGLPALKTYFPIINVSSNHLYDRGQDGFNETVKNLDDAGFQVVGNYNPHIEKDDCKAVILPVRMQKPGGEDNAALPVALCSYNYKTLFAPEPGELESIQKWSQVMPVIGLMNGGPEYEHQAGTDQMNVAHKMIDYGASFVVGNGTHWVQNTEVYKGKLIVYSMGNFIFDQIDYDGRVALNLSVGMTLSYDNNMSKWLQLGASCKTDTTTCFDQAQSQGLHKISPSFTFDAIGSYGGYQQVTTKANAQQQADIEQRANWPATQAVLAKQN